MATSDPAITEAKRLALLRLMRLADTGSVPQLQAVVDCTTALLKIERAALFVVHGDRAVCKAATGLSPAELRLWGQVASFSVAIDAQHVADIQDVNTDPPTSPVCVVAMPIRLHGQVAIAALCTQLLGVPAPCAMTVQVLRTMTHFAELEIASRLQSEPPDQNQPLQTSGADWYLRALAPGDFALKFDMTDQFLQVAAGSSVATQLDLRQFVGAPIDKLVASSTVCALGHLAKQALDSIDAGPAENPLAWPQEVRWYAVHAARIDDGGSVVVFRDVTEARSLRTALQRREAQMHQTEQIASIGGFDVAFPAGTGEFTRHTHRMLDLPDNFGGDIWHLLNLITSEAREGAMERLERAVDDGMLFDIEAPIETPAGRKLLLRFMGLPEYGDSGQCQRVAGAVQDITAVRAAEAQSQARARSLQAIALAQSEMLLTGNAEVPLRALLDAGMRATHSELGFVGICRSDESGTKVLVTRGWVLAGDAAVHQSHTPVSDLRGFEAFTCPTLCGQPVTTDTPIYVNDADDDLRGRDLPAGGVPVRTLLAMPFSLAAEVAGFLVLANRPAGYHPYVVEELEPLLQTCASVVASLRADAAREAATAMARDAEALWRTLFEMQVDGIVTCDAGGAIEMMNPAAELVFGYQAGDWRGLKLSALVHSEQGGENIGLAAQLLATNQPRQVGHIRELEGVRKDGQPFPLELSLSAYHYGDKHRFAGVVRDVSQRKAMEKELHARQELLVSSEEIAKLGSWSLNLATGELQGSDEYFRIVAMPREQRPSHRAVQDKVHPEDFAKFVQAFERVSTTHAPLDLQYRSVMTDGSVRDCHVRAQVVRDQQGRPVSLRGATQDVSELRTIERELRERESFLRRLTETAEEAIWAATLDGVTTFANPKYLALIGKTAEEVLGKSVFDYTPPAAGEAIASILSRRALGIRETTELNLRLASGRDVDVLVSASPLADDKGIIIGALALLTDISSRKRDERKLREQAGKLEAMNAELSRAMELKDNFLASMSHELRTPLNAILGLSEALQEEVYGSLTERQRKSLRTIEESGRHLLALINDILDLSKIEADRLTLNNAVVDIDELANTSLRLVRESAMRKGLTIKVEIDPAIGVLNADMLRLKQVLVNLLSNAIKFTETGGEIGLTAKADGVAGLVYLCVWDTGIGIAAEDQPKLFQPFVQLDSTLTRQHTGTGLGLALVDRLTKLHGGTVKLSSELGRGTQVTLALPWSLPEPAPRAKWRESGMYVTGMIPTLSMTADKIRVLLVDDNAANVETVRDYLESRNFRVAVASSGEECLTLVAQIKPYEIPHVVLMDIQMPGIDGLETTRSLRKLPIYNLIPVIAVTALAMPGDRERCLAAGMNEFLSKPVRLALLQETIDKLVDSPPRIKTSVSPG
ncbi:MAG: PAS domain S-box protein [Myxococcales bacterium]|nr:PAS domain S-box protein [Myxococcales bacterium]